MFKKVDFIALLSAISMLLSACYFFISDHIELQAQAAQMKKYDKDSHLLRRLDTKVTVLLTTLHIDIPPEDHDDSE